MYKSNATASTSPLTPQQHLNALLTHLEARVATLRKVAREQAVELAMTQEDLRANEMMLETARQWWEDGLVTA